MITLEPKKRKGPLDSNPQSRLKSIKRQSFEWYHLWDSLLYDSDQSLNPFNYQAVFHLLFSSREIQLNTVYFFLFKIQWGNSPDHYLFGTFFQVKDREFNANGGPWGLIGKGSCFLFSCSPFVIEHQDEFFHLVHQKYQRLFSCSQFLNQDQILPMKEEEYESIVFYLHDLKQMFQKTFPESKSISNNEAWLEFQKSGESSLDFQFDDDDDHLDQDQSDPIRLISNPIKRMVIWNYSNLIQELV